MSHCFINAETTFILTPKSQLNSEEFYLELCSNDFDVDINQLDGYPIKLIDLSVIFSFL